MKIIVTDGYAINPGDLDWKPLEQLGELVVYDRSPVSTLVERCKDADIILSNKTEIRKNVIVALPNLKMIGVLATGYNVIDVNAAKERNVIVCNVPSYGTQSVAQHTFALILALTNHVEAHAKSVSEGDWERSVDWSYSNTPLIELAGKTLGIVGLGSIGEQTARIAKAFGMTVIYNNRKKKQTDVAEYVSLDSLFEESDFISLHCPLTEENREFVNASLLRRMKPSAFIVNTARGQLINEKDLAERLNKGTIAGAGLDVLSKEPPTDGNPLLNAKNCIITPHNAWKTKEARIRVINVTAENIKSFMENRPVNVVTM